MIGLEPVVDKSVKSVMHCQCNIRPTVTFLSVGYQCAMTCTKIYSLLDLHICHQLVLRQVEFKIVCLVHQSLASIAPTYLISDIHLVSEHGRRLQRSSTDRTLTVPRIHNRFVDRSFAVAGPRLWNSLPLSLRKISSYGQFRRYLKNHLFGI